MRTVYLIQSINNPKQVYIGVTSDFNQRLKYHNAGKSIHTKKHKPFKLIAAFSFTDTQRANAFERYLKSGSGRAFAKRHFW